MEDKRKSVRLRANSVVLYKPKNTRLASGSRIKDVSETGICITLSRPFPVDSLLELEIRLDEAKGVIRTMARVIRVTKQDDDRSPFEVGLLFIDFPVVYRSNLYDYLRRSMTQTRD